MNLEGSMRCMWLSGVDLTEENRARDRECVGSKNVLVLGGGGT